MGVEGLFALRGGNEPFGKSVECLVGIDVPMGGQVVCSHLRPRLNVGRLIGLYGRGALFEKHWNSFVKQLIHVYAEFGVVVIVERVHVVVVVVVCVSGRTFAVARVVVA